MSDFLPPHGLYTVHGILQARILEWVAVPFARGSSQPSDWTQVSHIVGRFFTSRATKGRPRILERVAYPFSSVSSRTRESNQNLLHCRRILYQLSYEGSPNNLPNTGTLAGLFTWKTSISWSKSHYLEFQKGINSCALKSTHGRLPSGKI